MTKRTVYDNSNIAESYAGFTTPLTFSFAHHVYREVYQYFSILMGVSNKTIKKNICIFDHMIEFIGYRIYYNLNSWHAMLSFFPLYKASSEFMEKMMGVEKKNTFANKKDYNFFYLPKVFLQSIKIIWVFSFLGLQMKKFGRYFEKMFSNLSSIEIDKLSLIELKRIYDETDGKLLNQWKTPIANDFAVMVSTGLADKLFKKWLNSDRAYSYMNSDFNKPLAFLDPGKEIIKITSAIQQDKKIKDIFSSNISDKEILKLLDGEFKSHDINRAIENYLMAFGARMPNELKLESETLTENPENLIIILRKIVRTGGLPEEYKKDTSQDDLFKEIGFFKKIFLKWLLRWAGNSIRRREESRFYRTLIFGYVRQIFQKIGKKLTWQKIIENERDIFYFSIEEVFSIIENKNTFNPRLVAKQRKDDLKRWENISLPRRIESSKNISEIEREIIEQEINNHKDLSSNLVGRVASRPNKMDTLSGIALTLKKFDSAVDFKGKILVTIQTDPGWTIVFPLLKGIVVERGGILSHAAIVARELNIPCIVGADNATEIIENGSNIKIDLRSGLIKKNDNN
jgi:rifampicin phosphotransferase